MKSHAHWRSFSLVLAIFLSTAPLHAQEPSQSGTPAATLHITQSLRVKSPSVTVRAKPSAPATTAPRTAQTAFIDENGVLTSTPPVGFSFPESDVPRTAPVERRSAVDPNAILIDTSHIRAVVRARVGEDGKTEIECFHSTDPALKESCIKSHGEADHAPKQESTAKEDGQ